MTQYRCPIDGCNYTGSFRQMQGHFAGNRDSEHLGGVSKDDLSGQQTSADTESAEGGENTDAKQSDNPLMNAPDTSGDRAARDNTAAPDAPDDGGGDGPCCRNPDRRSLQPGTPFTLDDGTPGKAGQGDEFCKSCGAIIQPDGKVIQ
jgi:hypothetical protein